MTYHVISQERDEEMMQYHDLLQQMLAGITHTDYECYYFSYGPGEPYTHWTVLDRIAYTKPVVIWLAIDTLSGVNEFDWYVDPAPEGLIGFESICTRHPDKKFVLLTENFHMQRMVKVPNLKIVELPSINWWYDRSRFQYRPGYQTKTTQRYQWISFINNATCHRVATLSYLLANDLDRYGAFTASDFLIERCRQFDRVTDFMRLEFEPDQWLQLDRGFQRLRQGQMQRLEITPYSRRDVRNIANYHDHLLPLYNPTRVEIVCGSIYGEESLCINEKELQAIYACNFAIYVNCAGTVAWLRAHGFDVFDDVVNHDYDLIKNPGQRLWQCLTDNHHLLDGSTDTEILWQQRLDRFVKNCDLADHIRDSLDRDSLQSFQKIISELGHG